MKFLHASKRVSENPVIATKRALMPEKNVGYFEAFSFAWFKKHQNKFLWLLNTRVVRIWFRWVLRIHNDLPKTAEVLTIRPNSYTYRDGEKQFTDFRCHMKFSKRVYYAFMPMWWAMHVLDWMFLDRWVPQWSFGFTTLTAYPDANPESTTVDGQLTESSRSAWATYQSQTTCNYAYPSAQQDVGMGISYNGAGGGWAGDHAITGFDTSSIPSDDEISSATLSWYHTVTWVNNSITPAQSIVVSEGNIASNTNLTTSDWPGDGTTNFAEMALSSVGSTGYKDNSLNASGISHINKSGVTNFAFSIDGDFDNSEPNQTNGTANVGQMRYADYSGTSQDPKLVVEHAPPSNPSVMLID